MRFGILEQWASVVCLMGTAIVYASAAWAVETAPGRREPRVTVTVERGRVRRRSRDLLFAAVRIAFPEAPSGKGGQAAALDRAQLVVAPVEGLSFEGAYDPPVAGGRGRAVVPLRHARAGTTLTVVLRFRVTGGRLGATGRVTVLLRDPGGAAGPVVGQTCFAWVASRAEEGKRDGAVIEAVRAAEAAALLERSACALLAGADRRGADGEAALVDRALAAMIEGNERVKGALLGGRSVRLDEVNAVLRAAADRFARVTEGKVEALASVRWARKRARAILGGAVDGPLTRAGSPREGSGSSS